MMCDVLTGFNFVCGVIDLAYVSLGGCREVASVIRDV